MTRYAASLDTGDNLTIPVYVQLLVVQLDLLSSELRQQHSITHLHHRGDQLAFGVVDAGAGLQHHSVGGWIGFADDDAWGGFGLGLEFADYDPVE